MNSEEGRDLPMALLEQLWGVVGGNLIGDSRTVKTVDSRVLGNFGPEKSRELG